jgi:hypothetical protein
LLDPSEFSVREAKQALASPFHAGAEYCCTLQDWNEDAGQYDIAWATHALYCVPAEELEQGLARMCSALARDGFGFVAQGLRDGHYVGFYDQYLASMADGHGTPYSDGAQAEGALKNLGMHVRTRVLDYTTVVPADRPELLESYLQRCAFDDTFGLDEMLRREPLAGYLSSCHDQDSGEYRFPQRVGMTLFSDTEAGLAVRPTIAPKKFRVNGVTTTSNGGINTWPAQTMTLAWHPVRRMSPARHLQMSGRYQSRLICRLSLTPLTNSTRLRLCNSIAMAM